MLSICVALKNRSRVFVEDHELSLFPNCIASIRQSVGVGIPTELVVADWDSDDWPLNQWLADALGHVEHRIVRMQGSFSRGRGLNAAATAAQGDMLFFLDADCLLCPTVVCRGVECMRQGKAFFPVVYCFDTHEHRDGKWEHMGFGNCMVTRQMFEKAGGWPEYTKWGGEDDDFLERITALTEIVRETVAGFYHQWHPQDILWKDRYAERTPEEIAEIVQVRAVMHELAGVIPGGDTLVLVDEARFGTDQIEGRRVRQFLEEKGEYAGPPPDDATAIRELERMRAEGATFVAFAWMAYWWLEHYSRFREYLHSRYHVVLANERVTLFDLTRRPAKQTSSLVRL